MMKSVEEMTRNRVLVIWGWPHVGDLAMVSQSPVFRAHKALHVIHSF